MKQPRNFLQSARADLPPSIAARQDAPVPGRSPQLGGPCRPWCPAVPASSPRDDAIAELVRLLRAVPGAASVTVVGPHSTITVSVPPPPPAEPRDDDERDCRADILAVLRDAGRRLTADQILAELERRRWLWGETTVKRHLAAMVADATLDNDKDARPRGYRPASDRQPHGNREACSDG